VKHPWTFILPATIFFVAAAAHASLRSDQIALIVNSAEPHGVALANFYAQQRGIPSDHIIPLSLPLTDETPFDRYDRDVAVPLRKYLIDHELKDKIRCLVTFYGVPLRISDRVNNARDIVEQSRLHTQYQQVLARLQQTIADLELHAGEFDPAFKPSSSDNSPEGLALRGQAALRSINAASLNNSDADRMTRMKNYLHHVQTLMDAPVDLAEPMETAPGNAASTLPEDSSLAAELAQRQFDPMARTQLRELTRRSGGILRYARLLEAQTAFFETANSGSALDNELACLWWPMYGRSQWQLNPLDVHFRHANSPPTLMITRLDGPTPAIVHDLIVNSIATEKEGLKGKIVIDARGLSPTDRSGKTDPYGLFDERLRTLARMVQEKTAVQVLLDDKPAVLGVGAADDVALYCGWYSVHNYVPSMKFNRGAVGYHVASFELVDLHDPHETGWVRGLMFAGVCGTLGPVAEPYLHTFPPPDEFFPLLMSGKLTLAEVYWTTTPCVSWMQGCIGDPLYTPYLKNPAMKVEDLPPTLQAAIE
jgi:uncharacterized protein (TIGR03790 family)